VHASLIRISECLYWLRRVLITFPGSLLLDSYNSMYEYQGAISTTIEVSILIWVLRHTTIEISLHREGHLHIPQCFILHSCIIWLPWTFRAFAQIRVRPHNYCIHMIRDPPSIRWSVPSLIWWLSDRLTHLGTTHASLHGLSQSCPGAWYTSFSWSCLFDPCNSMYGDRSRSIIRHDSLLRHMTKFLNLPLSKLSSLLFVRADFVYCKSNG